MNVTDLNLDLARALGVETANCQRIVMTIQPGELPRLQVTKWMKNADGLQTAVEVLRLSPQPEVAPRDHDGRPEPIVQYLGEVERLQLQPGDALVLSVPGRVSDEGSAHLRHYMLGMFPGHEVVVLSDGLKLGVLRQTPQATVEVTCLTDVAVRHEPSASA